MKIALHILGYLIVVFSVIPLVRNDNWIFRIFEYPRFQKLLLTALVLFCYLSLYSISSTADIAFLATLSANIIYLLYQVFPYTPIASNQMKRIKSNASNASLSLLICNVFQDNRDVSRLITYIGERDPDIVLLVEVDDYWNRSLQVLHHRYPHRVLNPLSNTYGMSMYSKLELSAQSVKYLVQNDIPSIHTEVKLRNGKWIRLYGLHPEPPVPSENPRSTERDAEILLVAKEVENMNLPVIVAGDMNDVAWSYTTELFLKISGLLDPRRGRGFYNTFHVKYPLLRWPLDHVFCSKHFALVELQRLGDMGSDHFPIFISVQLAAEQSAEQESEKLEKSAKDEMVAEEKIQKAS